MVWSLCFICLWAMVIVLSHETCLWVAVPSLIVWTWFDYVILLDKIFSLKYVLHYSCENSLDYVLEFFFSLSLSQPWILLLVH